jgi:phospholipid-binding lipoprotein MlaA
VLEYKFDPIKYLTSGVPRYAATGLLFISKRAELLSASEVLDAAAVDPYLQVREAYRQKRWNEIHDGDPPEPDFFDEELFED